MIFGRKPKVEVIPAEGALAITPEVARRFADAAEAAGSERLLAIEHATERLSRYLREHRNVLQTAGPLILAGAADAAELVLDEAGGFPVGLAGAGGGAGEGRVVVAGVVGLWGGGDRYGRIGAARRGSAGLAPRPTGAVVAGLGVAGDDRASV